MEPRFDTEHVFDEDYLYFYEPLLTPERSDRDAAVVRSLLSLHTATEVLDCPCGHGRLANRLAAGGARVTGLDAAPAFLERARVDARRLGVAVDYVEGDMRALPWRDRFDALVCWFSSFGYFDDATDRRVLRGFHDALRAGGRVAIETQHLPSLLRRFQPQGWAERNGNYLLDERRFIAATGRVDTERVIVRDGRVRRAPFSVRVFTFTELRDWLLEAGFAQVDGYGEVGEPLTFEHPRMIVVASKR